MSSQPIPAFPKGRVSSTYRFNDVQVSAIDQYLRTLVNSSHSVHPRFLQVICFENIQHVAPASALVAMSLNIQGPVERFDFPIEFVAGC